MAPQTHKRHELEAPEKGKHIYRKLNGPLPVSSWNAREEVFLPPARVTNDLAIFKRLG